MENLNELNKEHSPSIPLGFPKERLPKELCKNALVEMLVCLQHQQENLCGYENKQYYICKRERDAIIFNQIRQWETQDVLPSQPDKQKYIAGLESERKEIATKFEKTPTSIGNKHKRWRMAADLEQLKWRIDYLKEL